MLPENDSSYTCVAYLHIPCMYTNILFSLHEDTWAIFPMQIMQRKMQWNESHWFSIGFRFRLWVERQMPEVGMYQLVLQWHVFFLRLYNWCLRCTFSFWTSKKASIFNFDKMVLVENWIWLCISYYGKLSTFQSNRVKLKIMTGKLEFYNLCTYQFLTTLIFFYIF